MIFYTILMGTSVFIAYEASRNKNKYCVFFIVLLLSLVAGLRAPTVGKDTTSYNDIFNLLLKGKEIEEYNLESSFVFLCKTLLFVFPHSNWLFFWFALLTHGCVLARLWDFQEDCSFPLMVFCYFCGFYFLSLNIMRQFCAVAIIFYATRFLPKGGYIKFLVALFLAILFHKSALLGLGFLFCEIFFWKQLQEKQKITLFCIGIVCVLGGVFLIPKILDEYARYFDMIKIDIGFMLLLKFSLLVFTFFCLLDQKRKSKESLTSKGERQVFSITLYYLIGILLTFLGYIFLYLERIGTYYFIFECVYMGLIAKQLKFKGNEVYRLLLNLLIVALYSYIFIDAMLGNGQGQIPYLFFWQ